MEAKNFSMKGKNEVLKPEQILVNKLHYKDPVPPKYFRCTKVDSDWGVVGYNVNGINDTIGVGYVRKAHLFEKILFYLRIKW